MSGRSLDMKVEKGPECPPSGSNPRTMLSSGTHLRLTILQLNLLLMCPDKLEVQQNWESLVCSHKGRRPRSMQFPDVNHKCKLWASQSQHSVNSSQTLGMKARVRQKGYHVFPRLIHFSLGTYFHKL